MCTISHALTIWLELDPIPMMFKIPVEIDRYRAWIIEKEGRRERVSRQQWYWMNQQ